jgi:hypothetical protein
MTIRTRFRVSVTQQPGWESGLPFGAGATAAHPYEAHWGEGYAASCPLEPHSRPCECPTSQCMLARRSTACGTNWSKQSTARLHSRPAHGLPATDCFPTTVLSDTKCPQNAQMQLQQPQQQLDSSHPAATCIATPTAAMAQCGCSEVSHLADPVTSPTHLCCVLCCMLPGVQNSCVAPSPLA